MRAKEERWAIPHFNFDNSVALRAIVQAAARLKSPVFVGTSEGERRALGLAQAVALVRACREEFGIPVFLNADHTKSQDAADAAADAGYDAVLIDGTDSEGNTKTLEENIRIAKAVVEHAKARNMDIVVEGEMGYMLEGSKVRKEVVEVRPEHMTDPKLAALFVAQTGVDMFAPAVGNIHGIAMNEPKLDLARIKEIADRTAKPLVLHGGSGLSDAQIQQAIEAGVSMVHVSTEMRVVFTDALRKALADNPEEIAPYKYLKDALAAAQGVVEQKIRLFGAADRL